MIHLINSYTHLNSINNQKYKSPPFKINTLSFDTVSFGAVKKNGLEGFDLVCANIFKAPLEKFKSPNDMKKWASNELRNLFKENFLGRDEKTLYNREEILYGWKKALSADKYRQNPSLALIIYSSITKGLKANSDNLPYIYNSNVLDMTVDELEKKLKNEPKLLFDFSKIYNNNLRKYYDLPKQGWTKFPSLEHDSDNFIFNLDKLKVFSARTWCTKNEKTENYLIGGDLYIYTDKYKPQICIRMNGDSIEEIQGRKNDSKIPPKYIPQVEDIVKRENLKGADSYIKKAKKVFLEQQQYKKDIQHLIDSKDYNSILNYFNIKTTQLSNGKMEISEYHQPSNNVTFRDLEIDEKEMMSNIEKISGKAIFTNSSLETLGNITEIGGFANLNGLSSLGKLKCIKGGAVFSNSKITSLDGLKYIGGAADFSNSNVIDLSELEIISGDAFFEHSKIKNFGNLKEIKGDAFVRNSIKLPKNIRIGGEIK